VELPGRVADYKIPTGLSSNLNHDRPAELWLAVGPGFRAILQVSGNIGKHQHLP